jgi:hypothetical protein
MTATSDYQYWEGFAAGAASVTTELAQLRDHARMLDEQARKLRDALDQIAGPLNHLFYQCTGKAPHREAGEPMPPYTVCQGCVADIAKAALAATEDRNEK